MAYSNNLVMYSSVVKRDGFNVSPSQRVEPVTVTVIEPKILPPAKRVPYVEYLLTFVLVSIGALGFMSYSLSFAHDVLYNSDRFEQVK